MVPVAALALVDAGVVDVGVVEFVVDVLLPAVLLPLPVVFDLPVFDLPAGPPAWLPLLFRGPLGEWDFLFVPAPVCLCRPVVGAAGVPTVIGISAPPPPPEVSVTSTVTSYCPAVPKDTCGFAAVELCAAPPKFQL